MLPSPAQEARVHRVSSPPIYVCFLLGEKNQDWLCTVLVSPPTGLLPDLSRPTRPAWAFTGPPAALALRSHFLILSPQSPAAVLVLGGVASHPEPLRGTLTSHFGRGLAPFPGPMLGRRARPPSSWPCPLCPQRRHGNSGCSGGVTRGGAAVWTASPQPALLVPGEALGREARGTHPPPRGGF